MTYVTIQKKEIGAFPVNVRVDVVVLSDGRLTSVVENPNQTINCLEVREFYLISGSFPIDVLVKAIVE